MAAINKPLLRLELCMSKSITKQEESELQKDKTDNAKSIAIAEYNKIELDKLIAEMEAISQVRVSMLPTSIHPSSSSSSSFPQSQNDLKLWHVSRDCCCGLEEELLGTDDPDAI